MIRTVVAPKGRARRTPLDRLTDRSTEIPCLAKGLDLPCWVVGKTDGRGYGQIRVDGRDLGAHRVAYTELIGCIPEGLKLDHLCRNRACWNPYHLDPVTHRVNVLRGAGLTAQSARRTHCLNGHLYDAANTYIKPNGSRQCRACHRDSISARRTDGLSVCLSVHPRADQGGCAGKPSTDRQSVR
jgi:hypothetical protein